MALRGWLACAWALVMAGCGADGVAPTYDAGTDAVANADSGAADAATSADAAVDAAAMDMQLPDAAEADAAEADAASMDMALADAGMDADEPPDMELDAPDPCEAHACENGASCVAAGSTYTCDCTDGYEGDRCERSIDDCAPNPCENGGMCTDGHLSFSCECTGGYFGETCSYAPPVISVSWDDSAGLMASDVAGYAPMANWNMAIGRGLGEGDNGAKSGLVDREGDATTVDVIWSGQEIDHTTTEGTSADYAMMRWGLRSWRTMGDATVTFSGLATEFPHGVRFLVYVGRGGGFPTDHSASFSLAVGDDTVTGRVMPSFGGTWDLLTGGSDQGNWYLSPIQTGDSVTITLAATGGATLATAAINGISIVPVEAP